MDRGELALISVGIAIVICICYIAEDAYQTVGNSKMKIDSVCESTNFVIYDSGSNNLRKVYTCPEGFEL